MATDYDASRKTEDEEKEESREARRLTSGEQDKTSGKVDEDETELAESYELPGADLSHETLSIEVTPRQADEFTCTACFLVQHESRRCRAGCRPLPRLRLSDLRVGPGLLPMVWGIGQRHS